MSDRAIGVRLPAAEHACELLSHPQRPGLLATEYSALLPGSKRAMRESD